MKSCMFPDVESVASIRGYLLKFINGNLTGSVPSCCRVPHRHRHLLMCPGLPWGVGMPGQWFFFSGCHTIPKGYSESQFLSFNFSGCDSTLDLGRAQSP